MTNRNHALAKRNEGVLGVAVAEYIRASAHARTERDRMRLQARVMIEHEQAKTNRCRIQAEAFMYREDQITERMRIQCQADITLAREQRMAFERLCATLKASLANGTLALSNIRRQFGDICQLMIERDLPGDERKTLIGLLATLLAQQESTLATSSRAMESFAERQNLTNKEGYPCFLS